MPRAKAKTSPETVLPPSILEKYKDFPGIKVIERRMQHAELPGSVPIRLVDEPSFLEDPLGNKRVWMLRWINGTIDGRSSMITDVHGYVPVRIDELQNPGSVSGLAPNTDGIVRRGDKGQEWLAKQPLEVYNFIKQKQRLSRDKRTRNAKLVKEDLANAAGEQLGSHAGDTVHEDFRLEVTHHGRTTAKDELASTDIA
jgi:hypothetical protein